MQGEKLVLDFENATYGSLVFIKIAKADDFYGEFTAQSGAILRMDGFGNESDGGYAIVVNGDSKTEYTYEINEGVVTLVDENGDEYTLTESTTATANTFAINGVHYAIEKND